MATNNKLLYSQGFTGTSINVTHNLDRYNLDARIVCSGSSRPDLIDSVEFTNTNERNEFVMRLTSSNTGVLQLLSTTKYSINLPSPANYLKLSALPQPSSIIDSYVTGTTLNSTTLELGRNQGLSTLTTNLSSINTYVTGNTYTSATDSTNESLLNLLYKGTISGGPYSLSGKDTYATGTTFSSNQSTTTRNDGTDVLKISGGTNVTLSNPTSNQINMDVNLLQNQFLLDIYQSGTTQLNESTYTTVDWDSEVILGSNYTLAGGGTDITINSTGTYQITYSISIGATNSFNQRMMSRSRLKIGSSEIPRSGGFSYHRTTDQDEGTISKTIITPLSVTDVVTLDAIKFTSGGNSNELSTIAGDSNITIIKLNDG